MSNDSELVKRLRSRESSPDIMFRMSDVLLLREAAEAIERYQMALTGAKVETFRSSPNLIETDDMCRITMRLRDFNPIRQALEAAKVKD